MVWWACIVGKHGAAHFAWKNIRSMNTTSVQCTINFEWQMFMSHARADTLCNRWRNPYVRVNSIGRCAPVKSVASRAPLKRVTDHATAAPHRTAQRVRNENTGKFFYSGSLNRRCVSVLVNAALRESVSLFANSWRWICVVGIAIHPVDYWDYIFDRLPLDAPLPLYSTFEFGL